MSFSFCNLGNKSYLPFLWVVLCYTPVLEGQTIDTSPVDSFSVDVARTQGDRWLGVDKAKHFVLSGFLTGLTYFTVDKIADRPENEATVWSGVVTLATGIGKEVYDLHDPKGHSSLKDLVADALGVAAALFIIKSF